MSWSTAVRWLPVAGAVLPLLLFLSPYRVAYDDHVTPCRLILETGALPAPEDCWECHQPPLYYVLGAGALAAARALTGALSASTAFTALKLLNLLLTLGTVVLLAALVRRWFPGRPGVQAGSLLLVLVTPAFVLSSVMVGNDAAVLLAATLTLWLAADVPAGRRGLLRAGAVGAAAGAAVLAKYNGFALVPAVAAALLWPWWHRAESGHSSAARLCVAAALFAAVTGPWLVRNVVATGTPLPTRMARAAADPTERYTLFDWRPLSLLETPFALAERVRPGETLPYRRHQVLTPADTSLWTKTWALWWHDALYYLPQPPPAWTAARYAASLPVCLAALLGLVVGLRSLLRRSKAPPPGAASHAASLVLVVALLALYFAFVARYPWVRLGHARAAFLLPLAAPFALAWGLGWQALTDGRPRWTRALLGGALGVVVALSLAYEAFLVG